MNFATPGELQGVGGIKKNYSPDKGIYEIYMQKPEKPSLSIHCATLFQKPVIIQGSLEGMNVVPTYFLLS